MADVNGSFKWSAGLNYGPVLSQIDLYLLQTELDVHPILKNAHPDFHLVFNMATGQTGGWHPDSREREMQFTQKDEPATMPRVQQLIILSEFTPWCTLVNNPNGVTLGDVITGVFNDYSNNPVTDAEISSVPVRLQDQIRRASAGHMQQQGGGGGWGFGGFTPAAPNHGRLRRIDWLRERTFFEGLRRNDGYVASRLGFSAPNIFIMDNVGF